MNTPSRRALLRGATSAALTELFDRTLAQAASLPPLSAASIRRVQPRKQIIATRGAFYEGVYGGSSDSSYTHGEVRMQCKVGKANCSSIRFVFAGVYSPSGAGEVAIPNDVTLGIAIEPSSAAFYKPGFFRGTKSIVLSAGAAPFESDILGLEVAADDVLFARIDALVTSGQQWPYRQSLSVVGVDGLVRSTATPQQIYGTGAITKPSGGATPYGMGPWAIIGEPDTPFPCVCIFGDSIARGLNDTSQGDGNGNQSFIERGLWSVNGHTIPWANMARASEDVYVTTTANTGAFRRSMAQYASHVICNLGTNDITRGVSVATLQTALVDLWTSARRKGCKVYQCCYFPRRTTGNTGYLLGGEPGGIRDQMNAWFLAGGGGQLDGVINVNPYVEDSANPGSWIGTYFSDGTHPNTAGHAAAAAAVSAVAATFTL